MTDLDFDFGFSAVDEDELEAVQKATSTVQKISSDADGLEDRLNNLYNAIMPLLTNLKANPEKEYILWPNRTNKIEQFEKKLLDIYNGN